MEDAQQNSLGHREGNQRCGLVSLEEGLVEWLWHVGFFLRCDFVLTLAVAPRLNPAKIRAPWR